MTAVIHVESLGKRYRIGELQGRGTLRDQLTRLLSVPTRLLTTNGNHKKKREEIWALRDVTFEVQPGEVVGLIGRNGSGKSTLLKVLSRVTQPTTGWAEVRGRMGSLLEVGTGFHPELTGRENIFLNGAILGMGKREIARKFDEIVAFSEVEKFIDTPVKHYSSGMYVRLAFAVAAHVETEILLVDEVLAVGDLAFQQKCLGKMRDVSSTGRTIIFISHQMNQIRRLCERVFWLDGGLLRESGAASDVIGHYEAVVRSVDPSRGSRRRPRRAQFLRWELGGATENSNVLDWVGEVRLEFVVRVLEPLRNIHHGVALYNTAGQIVWGNSFEGLNFEPGIHELTCTLPALPLRPGVYNWRVSFYQGEEPVDDWDCVPPMLVSTEPVTHKRDEFAGLLNIPSVLASRLAPGETDG